MNDSLPSVSVIIPARDAADSLPRALESIRAQSYPRIVEVIVAYADEATRQAAAGVDVVENPTGTTPVGLNAAIAKSTGDIIVRCDAHAVLPEDYVEILVEILESTGASNVGGMQVPVGESPLEQAIASAMTSRAGAGVARYRVGGNAGPVDTVYLGGFPRSVLERLNGYDEDFTRNQDYELNHRIINAGGKVWFDPRLRVRYRPRSTLPDLARQYFDYGRGKRAFARKHSGTLRPRQIAPPVLVICLVISLMLSLVNTAFLAIPLLYLGGLCVWSLIEPSELGLAKPLKPIALATMHLAWGAGFLRG